MTESVKLSLKQTQFIRESIAKINLAHGAVRSGKTLCTIIRYSEAIINCPDNKNVIIGKSLDSVEDNIIKPWMNEIWPGYCSYSPGNRVFTFGTKEMRVIGANDAGAVGRIQGNTISTALVDEMTILPQNFLDMLFTRLSTPHSILFGGMNPDTPYHPLKKMIDSADGKYIYALHFTLKDNPSLKPEYIQMLEKFYAGLWYKRFILGEWCLAEGSVYDFFDRKFHVVPRIPCAATYHFAAIDYGTSNPFCMLVFGYNPDAFGAKVWVEKEVYWDPKEMGRQKTNAEFADMVEEALYGISCRVIYIDPSAEAMQVELKKRGKYAKEALNDVKNGISSVSSMFVSGDLVICASCRNLIQEIEGYVWDSKAVARGEDEPLKVRDHACDALRYGIFSHFGARGIVKPIRQEYKGPPAFSGPGWRPFGGGMRR